MRGYSQIVIYNNKNAKSVTEGVKLGKICIGFMYPAALVAKRLHTSRQCVYDWFSGKSKPSKASGVKISKLIKALKQEEVKGKSIPNPQDDVQ